MEPHTGRCSPPVWDDGAGVRYFRLLQVAIDHRALQSFEDLFYVVESAFVDDQFAPEIIAEQGLGDIIGRGAEAAGDQDDLRLAERLIQCMPDIFAHISYCVAVAYPDPVLIQFLSHPCAVGVYDLSYQQFIADGYDTDNYLFHIVKLVFPAVMEKYVGSMI